MNTGPRVFLNCPLNSPLNQIEMWFINLWNHFIIPYLTATTLDGIKVCECVRIRTCCFYILSNSAISLL